MAAIIPNPTVGFMAKVIDDSIAYGTLYPTMPLIQFRASLSTMTITREMTEDEIETLDSIMDAATV